MKKIILSFAFIYLANILLGQEKGWIFPLMENVEFVVPVDMSADNLVVFYKQNGALKLLLDGKTMSITDVDTLIAYDHGRFTARKNGLWGLYDVTNGKFIIPPAYDKLVPYKNVDVFAVSKYGAVTKINLKNEKLHDFRKMMWWPRNTKMMDLKDGHYAYKINNRKLAMGPDSIPYANGKKPIDVLEMPDGKQWVKYEKGDKWELRDTDGHRIKDIVVPGKPDRHNNKTPDGIIFSHNKLKGLVSYSGDIVFPIEYNQLVYYADKGYYSLSKGQECALKDSNKKTLATQKCDKLTPINKYLYAATTNRQEAIYTFGDDEKLFEGVSNITKFGEVVLVTDKKRRIGILNEDGSIKFPFLLQSVWGLVPDVKLIKSEGNTGLLNSAGEMVTIRSDVDYKKHKKLFVVKKVNGKNTAFYDNRLNKVEEGQFDFEAVKLIDNKFLIIKKGNKYGIVDAALKSILPVEYDSITEKTKKIVAVKQLGKMGLFGVE